NVFDNQGASAVGGDVVVFSGGAIHHHRQIVVGDLRPPFVGHVDSQLKAISSLDEGYLAGHVEAGHVGTRIGKGDGVIEKASHTFATETHLFGALADVVANRYGNIVA